MKDYKILFETINKWLEKVMKDMEMPLSGEPETLIRQMTTIEAYSATLTYYLEEVNQVVAEARDETYPAKEPGVTSRQRELKAGAVMAPLEKVQGLLEGLKNDLKQKLIVAEAILGYRKVERKG